MNQSRSQQEIEVLQAKAAVGQAVPPVRSAQVPLSRSCAVGCAVRPFVAHFALPLGSAPCSAAHCPIFDQTLSVGKGLDGIHQQVLPPDPKIQSGSAAHRVVTAAHDATLML